MYLSWDLQLLPCPSAPKASCPKPCPPDVKKPVRTARKEPKKKAKAKAPKIQKPATTNKATKVRKQASSTSSNSLSNTAPRFSPPIFLPLPKVLRIGSVCSGMLSEHWALVGNFVHEFSVEKLASARKFQAANANVQQTWPDVTSQSFLMNIPKHDVLSAGFPCQSFSAAGLGHGTQDKRGLIYKQVLEVARKQLPRIVIMENVKGLVERHTTTLMDIVNSLQEMWDSEHNSKAYKVFVKVLNSCDYGLPQRRERVYICAIKLGGRPSSSVELRWPTPIPQPPLEDFWDTDAVKLASSA